MANIQQTVDVPASRRITIYLPLDVPVGRTILTFKPEPVSGTADNAEKIWAYNRNHPGEVRTKLQRLKGCLSKTAFGGLDGVSYQRTIRDEWDGDRT